MAILDRPMFQRPLTKDQLRQYGIPAFANGGVVQKFADGGISLGYKESGAISNKPRFNPFKGLSREDYDRMSPEEVLNYYYQVDQTRVPGGIREAESVDRLYNILRKSGPDLPGFMEELRKPEMTKPISGMEFQETAIKQLSEEQQKEAEKELVKSDAENIEDEISLIEETIKYKEDNNLDTTEDKDLLNKKKNELSNLVSDKRRETLQDEKAAAEMEAQKGTTKEEQTEDTGKTGGEDAGGTPKKTGGDPDATQERSDMERLRELTKERSALYKELIGDPEKMQRQQGFLQLAQFGLNLASARGGNLAEKIATSAKDPLQTFAALAREAAQDERAIEIAAIEGAEKQLALEKELAKKDEKSYQFQATIQTIQENLKVDPKEATRMALGLESDEQKGITAFSEYLKDADRPGDILGAAKTSGYVLSTALEDPANYADENGKIKKDAISAQSNKVFFDIVDGEYVPYQIKPNAFDKKGDYLDLEEDFVRLPGVKVVTLGQ